jgi:hypothetical protein
MTGIWSSKSPSSIIPTWSFWWRLHELVEAALCARAGITVAQVDAWDMEYEKNRKQGDSSEPGDHANCPYQKQHKIASMIEGIALFFLGIDKDEYERRVNSL